MWSLPCPSRIWFALALAVSGSRGSTAAASYSLSPDHPRIFVTKAGLSDLARRCAGPLADDYRAVKAAADAAVARGSIPELANRWAIRLT